MFQTPALLHQLAYYLAVIDLLRAPESCLWWHDTALDEDLWKALYHRDFPRDEFSTLEEAAGPQAAYADAYADRSQLFDEPFVPICKYVSKQQPFDYLIKTLHVGDRGVGKSSWLHRVSEDPNAGPEFKWIEHRCSHFQDDMDFRVRAVRHRGSTTKLQMWDTPELHPCYRGVATG